MNQESEEELGETRPVGNGSRAEGSQDIGLSLPSDCIDSASGITLDYFVPRAPKEVEARASESPTGTRYSTIRAHAKGGLGMVFLAQDHELEREVALKVIQPQFISNLASSTRFLLEAKLTGRLEHPGIVPIYGLGQYPDGRPFYAMRFIQGKSFQEEIETFHRANPVKNSRTFDSRDFRGLIRRFIDVCNAIHYAHEKGVIHRDIKPANVMLGNYGETLVVDWGLAKLLQPNAQSPMTENGSLPKFSEQSTSSTLDGDVMGTPLYMSPEQALGNNSELTVSSDIYSLGATLFVLITGAKPVEGNSRHDLLDNVRKGRIQYVRDKVPRCPRALDAICRRAMARETADRYPSAKLLAEDLDRWMADEAVQALKGRESWVELSGRLMRRYRNWTVSVSVALLLITLTSILAAFFVNDARRKEHQALNEASQYRQDALSRYRMSRDAIDSWLVNSSEALTYFPATQSIRKEMLTRAARDYATLGESTSADPELKLESIRAILRVGDIQMDQEEYSGALSNYQKALAALSNEPVTTKETGDLLLRWRLEAARAIYKLGVLSASELQSEKSADYFAESLSKFEQLHAENPQDLSINLAMVTTLNHNAAMLFDNAKYNEAVTFNEKAVAVLTENPSDSEQYTEQYTLALARSRIGLGRVLAKLGRVAEASTAQSSAIEQLQTLTITVPDHPAYLEALADAIISRAVLENSTGDWTAQLKDFQAAKELYSRLRQSMPDVPRYAESFAVTLTDIGLIQLQADRLTESLESFRAAQQQLQALVDYYPRVSSFRFHLAAVLDGLTQIYLEQGLNDAAIESGVATFLLYEQLVAQDPSQLAKYSEREAVVFSHIARARLAKGEKDGAIVEFQKARQYLEQLRDALPQIPDYRNELAFVLFYMGTTEFQQNDPTAKANFESALRCGVD